MLDEIGPRDGGGSYRALVTHVADRPGHDFRYAVDPTKIEAELGWFAQKSFEEGIRSTVEWYVAQGNPSPGVPAPSVQRHGH